MSEWFQWVFKKLQKKPIKTDKISKVALVVGYSKSNIMAVRTHVRGNIDK